MSSSGIVLVGGGGHCKAVIDLVLAEGRSRIHGIVDLAHLVGEQVMGVEVIGTDDDLKSLVQQRFVFLITAGRIGRSDLRERLFAQVQLAGGPFVTCISPSAYLAVGTTVGPGTTVGHSAIINTGAHVGANCIINTNSLLEHDAVIGDHVHVSTGAIVNGGCRIGRGSFIGSGAIVVQGVQLGNDVVIGAGSLVLRDVPEGSTMVGSPAKPLRR